MYKYLIIIIAHFCFNLSASDWRLVDDIDEKKGHIRVISCPDSNNCYVLAQFTLFVRLYKSTDQGLSWNIIYESAPFEEGGPPLVNIMTGVSPDRDNYFMFMQERPIIKKSTDGGLTFKKIPHDTIDPQLRRMIYTAAMYDKNIGWAVSTDFIYITKDGWETFQKIPSSKYDGYYSPFFINDSTILVTYASAKDTLGMLLKKYNIKQNEWSILFEFNDENNKIYLPGIQRIFFVNNSLGFGCGQQRTGIGDNSYDLIYRTKDGSYNWELVLKQLQYPSYGLQDISFYDAKNGVAVGQGGKILTTKDSGSTWITNELPPEMNMPLTMKVAWAGQHPITGTYSQGGGLFRYEGDFFDFTPDTTDTTDVEEYIKNIFGDIEVKVHFYRSQLYVSINDERFRKYKLQIYDIMGNVAMEQELSSGVGTLYVPYDISALTSGAYLYMISCQGVVIKTGKLISITN